MIQCEKKTKKNSTEDKTYELSERESREKAIIDGDRRKPRSDIE